MLWKVGDVEVFQLIELAGQRVDPAEFFPDLRLPSTADTWWLQPPFYDSARQRMVFNIQSYLVRCPHQVILVDACVGAGKTRVRAHFHDLGYGWLDQLHATGHSVDSVNHVILTHLHVDHVGWCTVRQGGRWTPTFPEATVLVSRADLSFWRSEAGLPGLSRTGDYMTDSITPVRRAGLLTEVDPPIELCPDVRVVAAEGHSPGHLCVEIASRGEEGVVTGDLFHHPVQLARPEISTRYCVDRGRSIDTRLIQLDKYARRGTLMFPAHLASPAAGRLLPAGDGAFRWEFADPAPPFPRDLTCAGPGDLGSAGPRSCRDL